MEYIVWGISLLFEDVNSWYVFMLSLVVTEIRECGNKLDNKE